MEVEKTEFDLVIIGAGPAGCTAALALAHKGLRVALVDKSSFPRDKICGDAIPGPAFKILHQINPAWAKELKKLTSGQRIRSSRIVSGSGKSLALNWVTFSYNAKRLDFDNKLWELVKEETDIYCINNLNIKDIEETDCGFILKSNTKKQLKTRLLIGADGANGICARKLTDLSIDRAHHCAAVRAYASGMSFEKADENIFFFLKDYLPGYLWIFPLPNGNANIGFGMLSDAIKAKGYKLREILPQIIRKEPVLQKYFTDTAEIEKIEGFGLPLGSRLRPLSGNKFMLCGDAGSLIDPLQGHGIDKAMISGKLAADTALLAFARNQFDATFLKEYDKVVYRRFRAEFKRNYRLMQVLHRAPWILEAAVRIADNPIGKRLIAKFS